MITTKGNLLGKLLEVFSKKLFSDLMANKPPIFVKAWLQVLGLGK